MGSNPTPDKVFSFMKLNHTKLTDVSLFLNKYSTFTNSQGSRTFQGTRTFQGARLKVWGGYGFKSH